MEELARVLARAFPSEPLTESLTIEHDRSDGAKLAVCGLGKVMDRKELSEGQINWLLANNVGKCLTVLIFSPERGLLMPLALTSQERIDQDLEYFRTWSSENIGLFPKEELLYVVKPDFAVHAEAKSRADLLLPEIEKLTNLQATVFDFHRWSGQKAEVLGLYTTGPGTMPTFACNNETWNPFVQEILDIVGLSEEEIEDGHRFDD
jgi:hypothetical protein